MLGYPCFEEKKGSVPAVDSDIMKRGLDFAIVIGQILFRVLSDTWGRHTIYGKEPLITIFGTILVILMPWKNMSCEADTTWIAVWRVVTGVGIAAGLYFLLVCIGLGLLTR
jgi:PHS family inorganic phosphate transporter-like MFS transporter